MGWYFRFSNQLCNIKIFRKKNYVPIFFELLTCVLLPQHFYHSGIWIAIFSSFLFCEKFSQDSLHVKSLNTTGWGEDEVLFEYSYHEKMKQKHCHLSQLFFQFERTVLLDYAGMDYSVTCNKYIVSLLAQNTMWFEITWGRWQKLYFYFPQ